ncbi:DUF998 domain-containing protein [Dactylosporangium vinaceum]|uniref:DUF998 domain-containing protein n=1 Tax=Dactylosporangium vinaceum TaxID=53362 RepID=A0ABV5M1L7_9ACTN|nr:DUF998 domain-containing protein [Dactylosporangium vinaceum]UAB99594.1 DUF998 domain-containing protein [Dactylosporangium vinaceum]
MSSARLYAGIAGPALFTVVTLTEGLTRPHYHPARELISELALTSRGWVQIANFLTIGLLLIAFATGLRQMVHSGPASVWGPRWVMLTGVALIAAGVFVTDPGPHYPPGATSQTSWHGVLHQIAGLLVFLSLAMTAFIYARRFARPYGVAAGTLIVALFLGASVMLGLSFAGTWSDAPAGLLESLSLYLGLAWLVALAAHLLRARSSRGSQHPEVREP